MPMGQRSITRLNALVKGEIDATTSNEDNIFDLERRGEIGKVRVLADNESLETIHRRRRRLRGGAQTAASTRATPVKGFVQALCEAVALGAARARPGRSYLHALFERQRSRVVGIHVPNLCPRRDPRATVSQVGKRRARHRRIRRKTRTQGKTRGRSHRSESGQRAGKQGFFNRLYRQRPEHGKYGE